MRKYDSADALPPSGQDSVASRTCSASASASEYTATVSMPSRSQVRMMRRAISARLAIKRRLIFNPSTSVRLLRDAHRLGQDLQHHFVRAAADRCEPPVTEHARDLVLPRVAHAAPELQARVG